MALEVFLAGTDVTLVVQLADAAGNLINVDSIQYRVADHASVEIVPLTDLTGFVPGDSTASVVIPLALNALTTGNTREIRNVELMCLSAGNTIMISKAYGIEAKEPLTVGVNSFQTMSAAELTALDIPNLTAWASATDNEKSAALIEARERIHRLNFSLLNSNINFGQDALNYVPEGSFQSGYVSRSGLFVFNGNLGLLNATQYATLPERFKRALRQAQVAEANFILGGDTSSERRQAGIVMEAIGDSRQVFRQTKALEMPVCRAALGYLSYFVTFGKRIGRS